MDAVSPDRRAPRSRRRLTGLVLLAGMAALAVAGCRATDVATQPGEMRGDVPCPGERIVDGVRVLSCAEAVEAAEAALSGLHWPILTAEFAVGVGNCPKMPGEAVVQVASVAPGPGDASARNLRCSRIGRNTSGTVVFTFWFGDPVRMYVALDQAGNAVASATFMDVQFEGADPGEPIP
jgi:hypothetical protein